MKLIFLVVLFITIKTCVSTSITQIDCEKIEALKCHHIDKICEMSETTVISSSGVTLCTPTNNHIKRIDFAYNKHIEYLPEDVYQNFPELTHFDAPTCSIKQLSKATFRNLSKLEVIILDSNLIERIESGTFESLTQLKKIYIPYNRINFVAADVFQGLVNLERLDLFSNKCINNDFKIPNEIKLEDALEKVGEQCSHE